MSLSTRLLVGYGYLVALVFFAAGSAAVGFFDVGRSNAEIVERNSRAIEITTELLESLERQDSATLAALLDASDTDESMEEADEQFGRMLGRFGEQTLTDDERGRLDEIRTAWGEYRASRRDLLSAQRARPLEAYERTTYPSFETVKGKVVALLDVQHEQMGEAGRSARRHAIRYGSWLGFLVVVALLSMVLLTRGLREMVIDRIAAIRDVAEAVASGDSHRRVRLRRDDELGVIGREFNGLLDRLEELERRATGRVGALEQRLEAVLEAGWGRAALYDADGQLVATTYEGETSAVQRYRDNRDRLISEGQSLVEGSSQGADGGRARATVELSDGTEATLRLVTTPSGKARGWIATFSEEGETVDGSSGAGEAGGV